MWRRGKGAVVHYSIQRRAPANEAESEISLPGGTMHVGRLCRDA